MVEPAGVVDLLEKLLATGIPSKATVVVFSRDQDLRGVWDTTAVKTPSVE